MSYRDTKTVTFRLDATGWRILQLLKAGYSVKPGELLKRGFYLEVARQWRKGHLFPDDESLAIPEDMIQHIKSSCLDMSNKEGTCEMCGQHLPQSQRANF